MGTNSRKPGLQTGADLTHQLWICCPQSSPAETTVTGTVFKVSVASTDLSHGKCQGHSRAPSSLLEGPPK